jgi:hypothetical protein
MKAEIQRLEAMLRLTSRALEREYDSENSSFAGQAKRIQAKIDELRVSIGFPKGKARRKLDKKKKKR